MSITDDQLREILQTLARARRDDDAWGRLYDGMWSDIYAQAHVRLEDDAVGASDVTQEVFFRLARHARFDQLTEPPAFRSYVNSLVPRVVADLATEETRLATQPWDDEEREQARASQRAEHGKLAEAFDQLSEVDRDVLARIAAGATQEALVEDLANDYHVLHAEAKRLVIRARMHLRRALAGLSIGGRPGVPPVPGDHE